MKNSISVYQGLLSQNMLKILKKQKDYWEEITEKRLDTYARSN